MARVSNEVKASAMSQARAEPERVQEIADEYGIGINTLTRWLNDEDAMPLGVAPPPVSTPPGAKRGRRPGTKNTPRPITEETAGQLCAGIFAMVAMADGPWWFLTDEERKALAGPAADSLRILPGNVADAINTYSAPAVFGTSLAAIIGKKLRIRRAEAGRPPGLRPVPGTQRPSSFVQPPRPGVTPPPPPQAPQEPQYAEERQYGAPPAAVPTDTLEALDAVRGTLSGGEDTEMEANLQ